MNKVADIVAALGGASEAAKIAGVHRTRVYAWIRSGRIPLRHISKLLLAIRTRDASFVAEDFLMVAA